MESFDLNRFWQWWKNEIIGLIPNDDVRRSATRAATVEVHLGDAGPEFHKKPKLGRPLPTIASNSWDEVIAKVRGKDRVVLSVPQSKCLVRNRSVPKSALPELGSILALDLAHSTPFSPESVFTGWFKTGGLGQSGLQPVAQVILKRDLVKPMLEAITQRKARVIGVTVREGRAAAHPFVSTPDGQLFGALKQHQWMRRCAGSLAAAALMAVMAGFAVFAKQSEDLRLLDVQIEALKEPTQQARAALEEKTKAGERRAALQRLRRQQMPALQIVEELSRLLPDGAWVQTFISEADTIRIEGQAQSAEPLILLLEASPLFRDVKFTSPVFKAAGESSTVQFSMSLGVEGLAP